MNDKSSNLFLQIRRNIKGISAKMLSKELRDLEINGLVKRTVHDTRPVTVEYAISEHGKTLIPVMQVLIRWGSKHRKFIKSK
jgi:DNA-binding HxlR family transcriptional regulator